MTSLKSINPKLDRSGKDLESPSSLLALSRSEFLNNSSSVKKSSTSEFSIIELFISFVSSPSSCSMFIVGIISLAFRFTSFDPAVPSLFLTLELVLGLFKKSLTLSLSCTGDTFILTSSLLRLSKRPSFSREDILRGDAKRCVLLGDSALDVSILKSGVDFGRHLLSSFVKPDERWRISPWRWLGRRREAPGLRGGWGLSTTATSLPTKAVCFALICGRNGLEDSLPVPSTVRAEIPVGEQLNWWSLKRLVVPGDDVFLCV